MWLKLQQHILSKPYDAKNSPKLAIIAVTSGATSSDSRLCFQREVLACRLQGRIIYYVSGAQYGLGKLISDALVECPYYHLGRHSTSHGRAPLDYFWRVIGFLFSYWRGNRVLPCHSNLRVTYSEPCLANGGRCGTCSGFPYGQMSL